MVHTERDPKPFDRICRVGRPTTKALRKRQRNKQSRKKSSRSKSFIIYKTEASESPYLVHKWPIKTFHVAQSENRR